MTVRLKSPSARASLCTRNRSRAVFVTNFLRWLPELISKPRGFLKFASNINSNSILLYLLCVFYFKSNLSNSQMDCEEDDCIRLVGLGARSRGSGESFSDVLCSCT